MSDTLTHARPPQTTMQNFLYSLQEILAEPEAAINDTHIDELINHLSETNTQPLSAIMDAVWRDDDGWERWTEILDAITPELKSKIEELRADEQAEVLRRERAAFLAGYFFSREPIALLGHWKKNLG